MNALVIYYYNDNKIKKHVYSYQRNIDESISDIRDIKRLYEGLGIELKLAIGKNMKEYEKYIKDNKYLVVSLIIARGCNL